LWNVEFFYSLIKSIFQIKMYKLRLMFYFLCLLIISNVFAQKTPEIIKEKQSNASQLIVNGKPFVMLGGEPGNSATSDKFALVQNGSNVSILVDANEKSGVRLAADNLKNDLHKVAGSEVEIINKTVNVKSKLIIVGTFGSATIQDLIKKGKINRVELERKREKFLIQTVPTPFPGVDEALVIAGSDKRGTIYGIYQLSEQIGVSPWYYWADVPIRKSQNIYVKRGVYTAGEPAVEYRGIFLNDEAPSLTNWCNANFWRLQP